MRIEEIEAAGFGGDELKNFGYSPNAILAHPRAITTLIRNDKIQSKYIGDLASEKPAVQGHHDADDLLSAGSPFALDGSDEGHRPVETGVAGFYSGHLPAADDAR
ncbi:hypothetical protein GS432_19540, partial [Rhodococcus hoagii]|nr:hypothetical protein [Prescottella equi]